MILETALTCLALNIYHETRSQALVEQIAVSQVVLNRVADKRFPNTICGVVKQAITYKNSNKPVPHKCQFSWYCDGKKDEPKNTKAWHNALQVAKTVQSTVTLDITEGATHYHATYVNPKWNRDYKRLMQVDNHIFYGERK